MYRKDILARREEIEKWISEKRSKAYMCRELRCKTTTLENALNELGISYAGNQGAKGHKPSPFKKPATDYLYKGSIVKTSFLKKKLIEDGIKEERCEVCDLTEWQGHPIPTELHHINGDRFDNRLENLQIICPNCHALTPNHAGKGSRRKY